MKTVSLPDGSVVPVIDLKAVQVHRHFRPFSKSDEYYVRTLMRDGTTRDVLEHLAIDSAYAKRDELVSLVQQAWAEIEPFEQGYDLGREQGRLEGHSAGFSAGKSEGYRSGWTNGWTEGRHSIVSYLTDRRERLVREQDAGEVYLPSRRRYIRNSIELLTNIIHEIYPEPPQEDARVL